MLQPRDWSLLKLAKRQEGNLSYSQVRELGFSNLARKLKLREGEWIRVLPGILRPYWADETWMQRATAASMWVGKSGALSHGSAALLHGLAWPACELIFSSSELQPLWLPSWLRHYRVRGADHHVEVRHGLRMTNLPRTLVDLATELDDASTRELFEAAVRQGLLSWEEMAKQLPREARRGRPGVGTVRRALFSCADRRQMQG